MCLDLFSGSSYASAYYVYLWAEVLDAGKRIFILFNYCFAHGFTDCSLCIPDGFDAFLETGDCFDPAVAARVRRHIYSAGNSADPAELFRQFRGRDPAIEPMLKKKGLM